MKTADFDYTLPPERIAQTPLEPRDSARLMVLHTRENRLETRIFREIGAYLRPGDVLVINRTRVIPARLYARKVPSGGRVEVFLLRRVDDQTWEVLIGGKHVRIGARLQVEAGPAAQVTTVLAGARRLVRFDAPIEGFLPAAGHVPLPPYITTPLQNPERYQTVFAVQPGSVAAPTAGLHFTPVLMESLRAQGIAFAEVTLHVGLDTFAPVTEDDPRTHEIHSEWCELSLQTAQQLRAARRNGGRIVAVGTTSVRTLESAARDATADDVVQPVCGATDLFILPGHTFKAVDAMITNFHLPCSSLLMLVSAFAGREQILQAYRAAIEADFRFYSFGDAMLLLP